jgi:hypothetical protein
MLLWLRVGNFSQAKGLGRTDVGGSYGGGSHVKERLRYAPFWKIILDEDFVRGRRERSSSNIPHEFGDRIRRQRVSIQLPIYN